MKVKKTITTTPPFFVGMQLPKKLSREARRQLATSVAPPEALALANKAAAIAKRSAEQNQDTV
jgi:ribosomal protein L11